MRVLLCDDDKTALTRANLLLQRAGYETVSTGDSTEALHILAGKDPPKIAILDWQMPVHSGPEICRRVRQHATALAVYLIILTGRDRPADIEEAFEAGANDFIRKPFEPIEFRARVVAGAKIVMLESEIRTLSGLLPICSWCKKIRTKDGSTWIRLEKYVEDNSSAEFTHGGCPECISKMHLR